MLKRLLSVNTKLCRTDVNNQLVFEGKGDQCGKFIGARGKMVARFHSRFLLNVPTEVVATTVFSRYFALDGFGASWIEKYAVKI